MKDAGARSRSLLAYPADVGRAAAWLRAGGVVACPTETFYALACDPESATGVGRVFDLKQRPETSALPVMAASAEQAWAWCGTPDAATARLAAKFWPGPLTLVVTAPPHAVRGVAAADGSVAIRVPDHDIPRALAGALGRPITATSANLSGGAPAASAESLAALSSDTLLVFDVGLTPGGAPSTIVDAREAVPRLVRAGAVAWERVLESLQG